MHLSLTPRKHPPEQSQGSQDSQVRILEGNAENPKLFVCHLIQNYLTVTLLIDQVRTYGMWYTYCAPEWSQSESSAICRAMGFNEINQFKLDTSSQVNIEQNLSVYPTN